MVRMGVNENDRYVVALWQYEGEGYEGWGELEGGK